jgi:hypothetical protein
MNPRFPRLGTGGEWSASHTCRCTLGEGAPGTHCPGGCVASTVGLDNMEERKFLTLPGVRLRLLGSPGRSQSLLRTLCNGITYKVTACFFVFLFFHDKIALLQLLISFLSKRNFVKFLPLTVYQLNVERFYLVNIIQVLYNMYI